MLGNPNINDVKERLARLDTENALVQQGFEDKGRWLKQCLNLQLLNKEADHIDTTTSSHEAFLEFSELGVSRFSSYIKTAINYIEGCADSPYPRFWWNRELLFLLCIRYVTVILPLPSAKKFEYNYKNM